ncbi:MAG: 3'-phosphoadenosine 5'-phosphosulfate sulfotransferase [Icmadophila ericetorum]|nr:3'-phosphoadenosine 5'-phosphosulfate sulfotransferase [Icmadophila ericetorum]
MNDNGVAPGTHAQQSNGHSSLRSLCLNLHNRIEAFLLEDVKTERLRKVQAQTKISLGAIQEALQRYRLEQISFSYNGGKDCLVLLVLYLSALSAHPSLPSLLQSIYIVPPHPFAEVDSFVASSSAYYHLALARYAKDSMKAAFAEYLVENLHVKAIFVGTRRTDPHGGKLTHFDMTDGGWPEFMRLHPVIDWHYAEIWAFIRHLDIPYCELYDQGYTSLGGTTDTHPNPALKVEGQEGTFRPAYELADDNEERLGRER